MKIFGREISKLWSNLISHRQDSKRAKLLSQAFNQHAMAILNNYITEFQVVCFNYRFPQTVPVRIIDKTIDMSKKYFAKKNWCLSLSPLNSGSQFDYRFRLVNSSIIYRKSPTNLCLTDKFTEISYKILMSTLLSIIAILAPALIVSLIMALVFAFKG